LVASSNSIRVEDDVAVMRFVCCTHCSGAPALTATMFGIGVPPTTTFMVCEMPEPWSPLTAVQ
jgi:hypothetical protein